MFCPRWLVIVAAISIIALGSFLILPEAPQACSGSTSRGLSAAFIPVASASTATPSQALWPILKPDHVGTTDSTAQHRHELTDKEIMDPVRALCEERRFISPGQPLVFLFLVDNDCPDPYVLYIEDGQKDGRQKPLFRGTLDHFTFKIHEQTAEFD